MLNAAIQPEFKITNRRITNPRSFAFFYELSPRPSDIPDLAALTHMLCDPLDVLDARAMIPQNWKMTGSRKG
jgi:hypothetical protein